MGMDQQASKQRSTRAVGRSSSQCNSIWDDWTLSSSHVDQTFRIRVLSPVAVPDLAKLPVVYSTDANFAFEMLAGIARILQESGYDAPPFLLVGIGYPGVAREQVQVLRARDLSFEGYPEFDMTLETGPGPETQALMPRQADAFLDFIESELFPEVSRRYPLALEDRTYFGHSLGGGFGLYTLFKRTDLFRRYIISSPGLVYHGRVPTGRTYDNHRFVEAIAARFIASEPVLDETELYLSAGADEDCEETVASWDIARNVRRFSNFLLEAHIPGLTITTEIFPGESHMSAWPIAFIRGLRSVFRKSVGRS